MQKCPNVALNLLCMPVKECCEKLKLVAEGWRQLSDISNHTSAKNGLDRVYLDCIIKELKININFILIIYSNLGKLEKIFVYPLPELFKNRNVSLSLVVSPPINTFSFQVGHYQHHISVFFP